ncbi:MAG: hypothetical protein V4532_12985 [Pseudomonadota bacterium]
MANNPTPAEITALWTAKQQEFVESRRRIRLIRQWLAHKVEPEVPSEFMTQADTRVKLAFPITTSLHTIAVMARKRPLLKRTPLGSGMAPSTRASKLERWANGCLTELEGQSGAIWKPLVASLFNQGECAVLAYPLMAHWEEFPEFDAEDPPARYQRDNKDRSPDEAGSHFRLDGKRTKAAYDNFTSDWKAHRIPLVVRVVPAEQCLPQFGPGMRLDGLLIRSAYTEDQLTDRGYAWVGGKSHPGPGRTDNDSGGTGMARSVILMEYWHRGGVCYYAGEPHYGPGGDLTSFKAYDETTRNHGAAEIDLQREFGINRLLACYAYGSHYPDEENPDFRGVPFLYPFLSQVQGAQNLMTAKIAHTWRWAYGGIGVEPMENAPPELLMEDGHPRQVSIPPMTAVVLPGRAVPLVHPGTAPEVDQSVAFLLNDVRGEMPQQGAFGGAGASSGHDRSLIRAHLEDAYGMVLGDPDDYSGAIGVWRWLGTTLVECATKIAETQGHSVPVYTSTDVADGQRRDYAEMTQDLADGLFDLTAYYPNAEGENLPWAQLLAEWTLQELIPHQQFLEKGLGDQSPERTIVDIQTEKFLFKTPQGQQILAEMVAEALGGQREQEQYKLQQQGLMTQDGTPTAALGGLAQGGGQGQLTGTAPGNPAQSALGGIIAGGLGGGPARADAMATMNGRPA